VTWRRVLGCAVAVLTLGAAGCGTAQVATRTAPPARAAASPAPACPKAVRLSAGRPIDAGRGVGPLTVDGDTVWAARPAAGTVMKLNGATPAVAHLGGTPLSLALGAGKLWVALRDAGRIVGLDPDTLATRASANLLTPVSVAVGRDGVWALSLDEAAAWRLIPSTGQPYAEVDSPVSAPTSMVMTGDELWIMGAANGGVSPVNAAEARVTRVGFDLTGRSVAGLSTFGPTVWLGEPGRHDLIRVILSNVAVTELPAPGGMAPIATAAAACGVWVADASGTLAYIDTDTGRSLAAPLHVGRSVASLVASGSSVWVSDPVDGHVVKVTAQPSS
jgi:hypothetical protein